MKLLSPISSIILSSSFLLSANPAEEQPPTLTPISPTSFKLDWDGTLGNTYFVQYSTDLISWKYMPIIKSGTGEPLRYGFDLSGNRLFLRLRFTDITNNDPLTADFDNDGISNWNEVRLGGSGTDPFLWDTDGDGKSDYFADRNENGMSDGWELLHGEIGALDPNADIDGDGWTALQESIHGTTPDDNNTDGDGIIDSEDADPLDKAIRWKKSPLSSYAVMQLEAPFPNDIAYKNLGIQSLGEDGHVVASFEKESGQNLYIETNFKTKVWSPLTGEWSGLLPQSPALRCLGTDVNNDGTTVFGKGITGVSENSPFIQFVSLRWDRSADGSYSNPVQHGLTENSGQPDWTRAFYIYDGFTGAPQTFKRSSWFKTVSVGNGMSLGISETGVHADKTAILRVQMNGAKTFVTHQGNQVAHASELFGLFQNSGRPLNLDGVVSANVAGSHSGWHAYSIDELAGYYGFGSGPSYKLIQYLGEVNANGSVVESNAPNIDKGMIRSVTKISTDLTGIARDKAKTPETVVVWSGYNKDLYVGYRTGDTGALQWLQPKHAKNDAKRLYGKINARGESLLSTSGDDMSHIHGDSLWKNGVVIDLDNLVDSTKWTNLIGIDINDHGMILVTAENVENSNRRKPLLLLPVDLDIIKPGTEDDTSPTEIAEDKEDWDAEKKEGGWVASLNWDDDDNDGGAGGHGNLNFTNDFDDEDGTQNEDDLLQLKVHRIALDNVKGRLKFDAANFRVWKKKDRTEEVKTEDTEFDIKKDEDLILYVEGKKITEAEAPKEIELQIKVANQAEYKKSDEISLHVATPIILCAGWGPIPPGEETSDIIGVCTSDDEGLGTKRIDKRKNTIVLKGKDQTGKLLFYQVDLFDVIPDSDPLEKEVQVRTMHLDKEMKMALSLEGSHVIYSGHSNYGLGPNFNSQGITTVEDYMNLSNFAVAGIDISEFSILEHGGPNFQVREGDISGAVNNQLVTIPVGYQTKRFPSIANSFTKKPAANGNPAYHFKQGNDYITIVNSTGDTPTLKYGSCFMNSCSSGRHFGLNLNKKVFFYTTSEAFSTLYDPDTEYNKPAVYFASVFVSYQYMRAIVEGKTWAQNADLLTDRQRFIGSKDPDLYKFSQ